MNGEVNTDSRRQQVTRTMLYDAVAVLGQDVCERWVRSGWNGREDALRRVQQGESPDVVARDVAR